MGVDKELAVVVGTGIATFLAVIMQALLVVLRMFHVITWDLEYVWLPTIIILSFVFAGILALIAIRIVVSAID